MLKTTPNAKVGSRLLLPKIDLFGLSLLEGTVGVPVVQHEASQLFVRCYISMLHYIVP